MYHKLPFINIVEELKRQKTFALFETRKFDRENHKSYLFINPSQIISCHKLDKVGECFKKLETALKKGSYLAGFISYECGYAFENVVKNPKKSKAPLIWFAVFPKTIVFEHKNNKFKNFHIGNASALNDFEIKNLKLNTNKLEFNLAINKIKKMIEKGETYQVNYTFKYKFNLFGSIYKFYNSLTKQQPVAYSSFIKGHSFNLLSFSPELFFRKLKDTLKVRPMKGTMQRGTTPSSDKLKGKFLLKDSKNRSENLMIVDLLRNDLGRISKIGTVKTKKLFELEKYETLYQMTSSIESKTDKNISLYKLFKGIFPSGSVTGAPKIRTMQIISELEKEPREVYTGAIGFIAPNKDAVFNVGIRTIWIKKNQAEMGIGSGIVYDSQAKNELEEDKLKARFLTELTSFELIETMLWEKNKIFLLKLHLHRIQRSALSLGFVFNKNHILNKLRKIVEKLNPKHSYRIRLLLNKQGEIKTKHTRIKKSREKKHLITISKKTTHSDNLYLYHKTTLRKLYDQEHKKYKAKNYCDVIFHNTKGEITEGAISNIFIRKNGIYYTPPLKCGLLPGTYRKYFMKKNKAKEKILKLRDLKQADEIYLTNSVMGKVKVCLT